MPIFKTLNNLTNYVEKVTIPQIANIVEREAKEELNKQIDEKVYKNNFTSQNGDFYENTFGLRNSAMAEMMKVGNSRVGKGIYIDIYINPKKAYYSFYGNENVTDKIVGWLNNGNSGGRYKGVPINQKPRGFFESTYQNLIKGSKLKKTIQNQLRQMGYIISRRSL